jgi:hypothetical protein
MRLIVPLVSITAQATPSRCAMLQTGEPLAG